MPDWVGAEGEPTAQRYRRMAEHEVRGLSPTYEALCNGVADDPEMLHRLEALPPPKRQPNLLLGSVRYLGGPVGSYPDFSAWVAQHWDDVAVTMRARRTQTNEPGRCATQLPVLAGIDGPIALLEVGASAGLCLYPDRWSYRYDGAQGAYRIGSGPELACVATGVVPWPHRLPNIVWRAGLDLDPLDVTDDDDVRWLESLIWPEQADRFVRLRSAVDIARDDPPRIVAGDLLTDLPALAADAPTDATLVVLHSAVLAYVPSGMRVRFTDVIETLRAERPTLWLSNEAPGVLAGTEQPPGGRSRFVLAVNGRPVARTGPHGQSLDWLA